jgi:hypothetical protein
VSSPLLAGLAYTNGALAMRTSLFRAACAVFAPGEFQLRIPTRKSAHSELMIRGSPSNAVRSSVEQRVVIPLALLEQAPNEKRYGIATTRTDSDVVPPSLPLTSKRMRTSVVVGV